MGKGYCRREKEVEDNGRLIGGDSDRDRVLAPDL